MKIKATLNIDEQRLRDVSSVEYSAEAVEDAFLAEMGWVADSGITVESYQIINEPEATTEDAENFFIAAKRKANIIEYDGQKTMGQVEILLGVHREIPNTYITGVSADGTLIDVVEFSTIQEAAKDYTERKVYEGPILDDILAKRDISSEGTWECAYLEWGGSQRNPVARRETGIGEIKGKFFYLPDGRKKKIDGKGFRRLRKVSIVETMEENYEKE